MRGSAQKHGHCLSLTREPKEVGAFWYKRPVQVDNGFFTAFNIKINPLIQSQKGGRTGGEGMAFVLHRSPARFSAIGLSGPSLGYGGLKDALVIEFDSRQNKENEDPNGNHVSLHLPRDIPGNKEPISNAFEYDISLSRTDVPVLVSGKMFTVQELCCVHHPTLGVRLLPLPRSDVVSLLMLVFLSQVSYDGEVIKIFLNDLVNPILKYKVALSGEYWLGFTASTGHTEEMNHLFELLEATCAGAIFAVVVSYSVNYSLFLLTTYTLYSMGLGLLFMVIGGLILWQTLTQHFEGGNPYGELLDTSTTSFSHCVLLCCFSIFLATCGVLCFMLEGDFAVHMSPMTRVMVYAAVGIALCFSFVFVAVDLATRSANICR
eukprot:jgi/Bigna1/140949/aug1.59_g15657